MQQELRPLPVMQIDYRQSWGNTHRTVKAMLIAPLYLSMAAGTGGLFTVTNLPEAAHQLAGSQPSSIFQIRGQHAKRKQIASTDQQLRLIRETFGLTMTELAQVLGVSRPTAYSWINGADPKELSLKMRISRLNSQAELLRRSGSARIDALMRQPIFGKESLIDRLKAGRDVNEEISSLNFSIASSVERSRVKRDFGPPTKVRRVRTEEISAPFVLGAGEEF